MSVVAKWGGSLQERLNRLHTGPPKVKRYLKAAGFPDTLADKLMVIFRSEAFARLSENEAVVKTNEYRQVIHYIIAHLNIIAHLKPNLSVGRHGTMLS